MIDIEKSEGRHNPELGAARETLHRVVDEALTRLDAHVAKEDRGDGLMLVLDAAVLDVLDHIAGGVLDGVLEHNRTVAPLEWLRVRIAVHEGYVHRDEHGWSSGALTTTFRLNEAQVVKQTLERASRAQGILVVSDEVYRGVVQHNYRPGVTADEYRSAVISTKTRAGLPIWVRVPGYSEPPLPDTGDPPAAKADPVFPPTLPGSIKGRIVTIGDVRADMINGRDYRGGGRG